MSDNTNKSILPQNHKYACRTYISPSQIKTLTFKSINQQLSRNVMIGRQANSFKLPESCYPKIHNVVATVNLGCKLDLKQISWKGRSVQYNPQRFSALIMRLQNPKTTGLIFSSGKVVITGAQSEQDCELASRKYARCIEKMGFNVKYSDFKVQNVVASTDVKFIISLSNLEQEHRNTDRSRIDYQADHFPGLIYRLRDPKITFLIFTSGKIVIMGAKSQQEIRQNFEQIYVLVRRCEKKNEKS